MKKYILATVLVNPDKPITQNWPLVYSDGKPYLVLLGNVNTEKLRLIELNPQKIADTTPFGEIPPCYQESITPDDHPSSLHALSDFEEQL